MRYFEAHVYMKSKIDIDSLKKLYLINFTIQNHFQEIHFTNINLEISTSGIEWLLVNIS